MSVKQNRLSPPHQFLSSTLKSRHENRLSYVAIQMCADFLVAGEPAAAGLTPVRAAITVLHAYIPFGMTRTLFLVTLQ